jgi:hypothetical protein
MEVAQPLTETRSVIWPARVIVLRFAAVPTGWICGLMVRLMGRLFHKVVVSTSSGAVVLSATMMHFSALALLARERCT